MIEKKDWFMMLHQGINNIETLYYVYKSSIINHIVFNNSNILYKIFNFGEINFV